MAYVAKTLSGAQARVRQLQRQIREIDKLLGQFAKERVMLAKLAADTPQFYNPIIVAEAKQIRDRILAREK
jgi:succinate dehydrogenase flavin-adding protein (antitoxin of CptAB toxin-antitoxin module)